jgi:hypothetical protein
MERRELHERFEGVVYHLIQSDEPPADGVAICEAMIGDPQRGQDQLSGSVAAAIARLDDNHRPRTYREAASMVLVLIAALPTVPATV